MADGADGAAEQVEINWDKVETAAKGEKPKTVEAKVESQSPDEELAKIKAELADRDAKVKASQETAEAERRARLEAEQRALNREQEAVRLRSEATTAHAATVESTLTSLAHEQSMAKSQYRAAIEAGDYDRATEAQVALATVSARMVQVEQIKATPRYTEPMPAYVAPRVNDAVEGFLSNLSPASQAWVRQHREVITSDAKGVRLSPKVMSAHYAAEANNLTPDTTEYFQFIEQQLAPPAHNVDENEVEVIPTPAPRRSAPVSAPVSREGQSTNTPRPERIRLTAEQAEAAAISGLSPIEYWKNLQELKAEGKIGRTTH